MTDSWADHGDNILKYVHLLHTARCIASPIYQMLEDFLAITFDKTQTSSLTLNDKLHSSLAFLMMLDVTVPAREIRRRVASYPEFCSAGCMLHDTISITMYSIRCLSCSVQCTVVQYSVQCHAVYSVQVPGADL